MNIAGHQTLFAPRYDAEIEYLESTGTQWIDTGIPKANTAIKAKILSNENASSKVFFGMGGTISSATRRFAVQWNNGTIYPYAGTGITSHISCSKNVWHIMELYSSGRFVLDENEIQIDGAGAFSSNWNIYLFTRNWNGTSQTDVGASFKLSSVKLYQDDILVFDGVPVRKNSVGFLFDKVSKRLFGNKGTGSFTLGPDITA